MDEDLTEEPSMIIEYFRIVTRYYHEEGVDSEGNSIACSGYIGSCLILRCVDSQMDIYERVGIMIVRRPVQDNRLIMLPAFLF